MWNLSDIQMECKGRFPIKMLKKGRFAAHHFDVPAVGGKRSVEFLDDDSNTSLKKRIIIPAKPTNDIRSRLLSESEKRRIQATSKDPEKELVAVQHFVDLLDKMLTLNLERRPTVRETLSHPFFEHR